MKEKIVRFLTYSNSSKFKIIKNLLSDVLSSINVFKFQKMKAGFVLYVSPDISKEFIKKGSLDEKETKLIKRLDLKNKTVYDIGAHHGYYSFLLSKSVGPEGRVFAFEPSPRERFYFKISQFLNHSNNIWLMPFGVSSRNGKSVFYQVQGLWTGLNSLRLPNDKNYKFKTKKIKIKLIKLDSFVKSGGHPEFIKMDTEGAEYSIIKGASKLIKLFPPLLLMELEDKRSEPWGYKVRELVSYLKKNSYLLYKISEGGFLIKIHRDKAYEGNYFLIPKMMTVKYKHLMLNK